MTIIKLYPQDITNLMKNTNNIINIEGNKKHYKGLLERNHIYYSKLISNSLSINDSYINLVCGNKLHTYSPIFKA